jgi:hypothetical protein
MPAYQPKPTDTPTPAEVRQWEEEAETYLFKPSNPNAPPGSIESKSWGIPRDRLPPADAAAYVLAHFREDVQGIRNHDKNHRDYIEIHSMFKWSLVSACMAHFLWFRTPEGARWIMGLFGVKEVEAFREGYHYFWVDPRTQESFALDQPTYRPDPYNPGKDKLAGGVELRIFRQWEKVLEPPCSPDSRRPVDAMKKLMEQVRNPYAKQPASLPDDQVFFWVGEKLRDWFLEAQPDRNWPTPKADRIVGWQWVRKLERSPGVPFFEGIEKVGVYKGRAYRIKTPDGGIKWCGGKEIRIVPLKDLYRAQGQMSESQATEMFQCQSCRKTKACVPYTGTHKRCCHCYGIECETGDRPTLDKCTMDRECKTCPDVLTSHQDLVTIKTRLSRSARTGPVPR